MIFGSQVTGVLEGVAFGRVESGFRAFCRGLQKQAKS